MRGFRRVGDPGVGYGHDLAKTDESGASALAALLFDHTARAFVLPQADKFGMPKAICFRFILHPLFRSVYICVP
jgi:hypothetical protein